MLFITFPLVVLVFRSLCSFSDKFAVTEGFHAFIVGGDGAIIAIERENKVTGYGSARGLE
jgi:hypothetical protein